MPCVQLPPPSFSLMASVPFMLVCSFLLSASLGQCTRPSMQSLCGDACDVCTLLAMACHGLCLPIVTKASGIVFMTCQHAYHTLCYVMVVGVLWVLSKMEQTCQRLFPAKPSLHHAGCPPEGHAKGGEAPPPSTTIPLCTIPHSRWHGGGDSP